MFFHDGRPEGVAVLHSFSPPVQHRDLKALSVLLRLGTLSRLVSSEPERKTHMLGICMLTRTLRRARKFGKSRRFADQTCLRAPVAYFSLPSIVTFWVGGHEGDL